MICSGRVVIITGAGEKAFCAGGDVKGQARAASERGSGQRVSVPARVHGLRSGMELSRLLHEMPKPTLAVIPGPAAGAGLSLALACDLRVASSRAIFGQPEINLGLIPGGGGTQRLCRLLGYGKAMEMTLTGEMVGAAEAMDIGLVNKVVESEELESAAMALAENIARKSPYTVKVAKRAVRSALDLPFSEGVLAERSEFVALFDTEDKEIGVSAFLDGKDAEWVGR